MVKKYWRDGDRGCTTTRKTRKQNQKKKLYWQIDNSTLLPFLFIRVLEVILGATGEVARDCRQFFRNVDHAAWSVLEIVIAYVEDS